MNPKILALVLVAVIAAGIVVTVSALTPKETEDKFFAALVEKNLITQEQLATVQNQKLEYEKDPSKFLELILERAKTVQEQQKPAAETEEREAPSE